MYVLYYLFNGIEGKCLFYRDNDPYSKFDSWYPSECIWYVPFFSYDSPHQ